MAEEPTTLVINLGVTSERWDALMARVDDLQNHINALDATVRGFLDSSATRVGALQSELDTLRADDTIEDSKLTGMQTQVDALRSDVEGFQTPVAPPQAAAEGDQTAATDREG